LDGCLVWSLVHLEVGTGGNSGQYVTIPRCLVPRR
jgi:hypothetical protein